MAQEKGKVIFINPDGTVFEVEAQIFQLPDGVGFGPPYNPQNLGSSHIESGSHQMPESALRDPPDEARSISPARGRSADK